MTLPRVDIMHNGNCFPSIMHMSALAAHPSIKTSLSI